MMGVMKGAGLVSRGAENVQQPPGASVGGWEWTWKGMVSGSRGVCGPGEQQPQPFLTGLALQPCSGPLGSPFGGSVKK